MKRRGRTKHLEGVLLMIFMMFRVIKGKVWVRVYGMEVSVATHNALEY